MVSYATSRYSTARFEVKEAREAIWARRLSMFFVQLMILTVLLHRFTPLATPAALNLLGVSMLGLVVAIVIAVVSLVRIWFGGQTGALEAFTAIFISIAGLAPPLYFLHYAVTLPRLTEVQTTPGEPLNFKMLNTLRPADANPLHDADDSHAEEQAEAYPDIGPMLLERSAPEVFSIVEEAVQRLGWNIALSEPPGESGVGHIEATTQSLIMGFTDDVIVQVKGDDAHAVIDVRSVSRYGPHDLGANAERIRRLFAEVNAALEKGEKTILEQANKKKDEDGAAKRIKKPARKKGGSKKP
jgi:hypothetical protein